MNLVDNHHWPNIGAHGLATTLGCDDGPQGSEGSCGGYAGDTFACNPLDQYGTGETNWAAGAHEPRFVRLWMR